MRKSESILKLEEMGLNTPDYFITKDKREVIHYLGKHANDDVSMRTERGDEFKCPFYYMLTGETLLNDALRHLSEGYILIFSPSLDTKGCIAFGTVGLGESAADVMEFVLGPGKVRDLDSHPSAKSIFIPKGALQAVTYKDFPDHAAILNTIYRTAKLNAYDEIPCVLEWSWYKHGVGRKSTQDVWWELRPYA